MAIEGGNGGQNLTGTSGDDLIFGHSAADADPLSGRITTTTLASGLAGPLAAVAAPGDPSALYVLEKDTGRVVRVDLSTGDQTTFLDIPQSQISTNGERGALGLAFHPDYASNGRLFVNFTKPNGDINVVEYARSSGNPLVADASPLQSIITIPHSTFSNHNGGALAFKPQ